MPLAPRGGPRGREDGMAKRNPLVVGLDVGTYKIGVVVAELSTGGVEITGAAGAQVKGFNSHGVVAVKNREVGPADVERVMDAARAVAVPTDREVLHVLPQEFIVDDQDGIREPIGMAGVRLEARVHIVTSAVSAGQNLIKCCNRAGLHVRDALATPLAAAEAVLTPEERELGVALLDVGAGTTDVVVVHAGAVRHTAVLPVGGAHMTNDLAAALRTPFAEAVRLKARYGGASVLAAWADPTIEVPGLGGRAPTRVSPRSLAEVIEPRAEELLALAKEEIKR